jgi:hypothetical protein
MAVAKYHHAPAIPCEANAHRGRAGERVENVMRAVLLAAVAAVTLAGCQTMQQRNAATGALIGGATGAVIGGVAGHSAGAALAGGILGAAAGGIIGAATAPPEPCYIRTRSGKLRRVPC